MKDKDKEFDELISKIKKDRIVLRGGIVYAGDYENSYTERSLVTKEYIDKLIEKMEDIEIEYLIINIKKQREAKKAEQALNRLCELAIKSSGIPQQYFNDLSLLNIKDKPEK